MKKPDNEDNISYHIESGEKTFPFPYYVGFILGNEFCERYSYYGMRTILVLYLTYFIGYDENTSTVIYHAFTVAAYTWPLFGGALADSYLGKYKTILYISICYVVGMIINTIGTLPQLTEESYNGTNVRTVNAAFTLVGLFVIAFGTGGIKPCVSSFGGDQFEEEDKANTRTFFDLFYFSVNAGSLMSTFLSPFFRTSTCGVLGTEDSCYFIAFGVPAILMVVAIFFFMFGTKYYKITPPVGKNIFWEVIKCVWYGLTKPTPEDAGEYEYAPGHWLWGAKGHVDDWLIRDSTYLLRVLIMFTPIPAFRAAFDQQGSRWTLQAVRMSGYIGDVHILPDQTQLINPILILTFIPIFNFTYRGLDKCFGKGTVTQLRKIALGMFVAGVAYIVAAAVQGMIDVNLTKSPEIGSEMAIRVLNMAGKDISGEFQGGENVVLDDDLVGNFMIPVGGVSPAPGNLNLSSGEVIIKTKLEENAYSFKMDEGNVIPYDIIVGKEVWTKAIFTEQNQFDYASWANKDLDGKTHLTLLNAIKTPIKFNFTCQSATCDEGSEPISVDLNVCEFDSDGLLIRNFDDKEWPEIVCLKGDPIQGFGINIWKGQYKIEVFESSSGEVLESFENFEIGTGAAFTFSLQELENGGHLLSANEDIKGNDVQCV